MTHTIPISEIFGPTLQGEGPLIGKPCVFVRVGGCDYRCNWCDTLYAVLPQYKQEWQKQTQRQILEKVLSLTDQKPMLVTLSGGNPALYDFSSLLEQGHKRGFTFALETQGSVAKPWFEDLEYLILSPKGPSSGMETDWDKLENCTCRNKSTFFKIVIFSEEDYQFARECHARFGQIDMYLQLGTPINGVKSTFGGGDKSTFGGGDKSTFGERANVLLERVVKDGWSDVAILPQLHVMLWGHKRGV